MSQRLPLATTADIGMAPTVSTERPDPQASIQELRAEFGDDALRRFEHALRIAHAVELDEMGFGYAGSVLRARIAH